MDKSTQKPTRIWGLDLAGLGGSNNTGLAMIETKSTAEGYTTVTVFDGHPFNHASTGTTRWDDPMGRR